MQFLIIYRDKIHGGRRIVTAGSDCWVYININDDSAGYNASLEMIRGMFFDSVMWMGGTSWDEMPEDTKRAIIPCIKPTADNLAWIADK